MQIRDIQSDRIISVTSFKTFSDIVERRWIWIKDTIARHYDCDTDDVDCVETEEHLDAFAVKGEIVAYLD